MVYVGVGPDIFRYTVVQYYGIFFVLMKMELGVQSKYFSFKQYFIYAYRILVETRTKQNTILLRTSYSKC